MPISGIGEKKNNPIGKKVVSFLTNKTVQKRSNIADISVSTQKSSTAATTTQTAMNSDRANTRKCYGRFCFCDATGINFSDLRELILMKQCRICPACKLKWRNIILIEQTMTVFDLICSIQGIFIILFVILQFAVFYFIAFLAVLDVEFARTQNIFQWEREILFNLTIVFVVVATWNLGWYVYKYAEVAVERVSEKIIVDVILDLSNEFKRHQ